MNRIQILRGSVVHSGADAIVNAANSGLQAGGGVCGAIFAAAGRKQLTEACRKIGGCPTGGAVITPGFGCGAKYIIHAVGPVYSASAQDAALLRSAYRSCMERAEEAGLASIAFCSISTGIYGYPLEEAAPIALDELRNFPAHSVKQIMFCLYGETEYEVFRAAARQNETGKTPCRKTE